jgi:AraC family transcriptional regulator of adaptative response/methylated-DNA-[protein]-cysteine methyltransferase
VTRPLAAGFPDSSSYYRQADAALGMTASQFRRGGADRGDLDHGRLRAGPLRWRKVNAASARCCRVITMRHCSTTAPPALSRAELRQGDLSFVADGGFRPPRRQPAAGIAAAGSAGHPFQLQVWQALRQIPAGRPAATARWQSILASRGR